MARNIKSVSDALQRINEADEYLASERKRIGNYLLESMIDQTTLSILSDHNNKEIKQIGRLLSSYIPAVIQQINADKCPKSDPINNADDNKTNDVAINDPPDSDDSVSDIDAEYSDFDADYEDYDDEDDEDEKNVETTLTQLMKDRRNSINR